MKARGDGFTNIFDALTKLLEIGVNRKTIESLIYASCFDSFGYNKNTLLYNLDNLLTYAFIAKGLEQDIVEHPSIEVKEEFPRDIRMEKEKELFGFYLSYHPVTKYKNKYNVISLNNVKSYFGKVIDTMVLVERVKKIKDKNGNDMVFVTGSDDVSVLEYIIFSKVYQTITELKKGDILLVRGKVERKENYQIIAEKAKIIA